MRPPPRLVPLTCLEVLLLRQITLADDKADSTAKRLAAESAGRTAVQKIKDTSTADKTETTRIGTQITQFKNNKANYTLAQQTTMISKWKSALVKLRAGKTLEISGRIHARDAVTHMMLGNGRHKAGQYNDVGMNPVIRGSKWRFDQAKSEYEAAQADAVGGAGKVTEAKNLLDDVQAILDGS